MKVKIEKFEVLHMTVPYLRLFGRQCTYTVIKNRKKESLQILMSNIQSTKKNHSV